MRRLKMMVISLCGVIALIIAAFNPLMMLLAVASITTLIMALRMLNNMRVALMIKRFIQTANQLRVKFRANMRMGFRDYSGTQIENEESSLRNSHCGYVR